jgi:hypothetical protein
VQLTEEGERRLDDVIGHVFQVVHYPP